MENHMDNYIEAGKIVNTHGVKGELRIEPWVDSADFLKRFSRFVIDSRAYRLLGGRVHKSFLIARLEGVEDVNAAMSLKNKTVYIDRSEAKLPKGHFFLKDIIGASVQDEAGKNLGILTDVLDAPASRVYVVSGEREILIPAVPEFILKTDTAKKILTVRLIEGM
jgi:16S rRNA processing protein RimM